MASSYELGLWLFALSGWFGAFCIATSHKQIVKRVLDALAYRESTWRERSNRLGDTESGIYSDGYSDGYASGLREAQEILHRQTHPPRGRGPRVVAPA